jgi:multidrug efflux pump subunit AcrB
MTALNRFARAAAHEFRSRPIGYGVLAVFTLGGPLVAHLIFPEAPLGVGIVGGLALGAWAALSAVPDQFL